MKECLVRMLCIPTVFSLGLLGCSRGGGKPECNEDADCKAAGERCHPVTHKCRAQCVTECGDRKCGPDPVCGKSCGSCPFPQTCDARGRCVDTCTPDCGERDCGLDPVCRQIDCGTCTLPEVCNLVKGTCIANCTPDCGARKCGLDPLCSAIDCGGCDLPEVCDKRTGSCGPPCQPECGGRECGLDPICEALSCGTCEKPNVCNPWGECEDQANHPGALCPNGGGDCPSQWPACVFVFFSSYCSKGCIRDENCGSGNCCLSIGGIIKFCLDPTLCPSSGCDPVAQTGCAPDENCVPWTGTNTKCIPIGPQKTGQPCSEKLANRCQAGHLCGGVDANLTCLKFCDILSENGCSGGEPCIGIAGVVRWGICLPVKKCKMENMGAECLPYETCTLLTNDCSVIGCLASGGKAEGEPCEFSNSCGRGLFCLVGSPGFCAKICTRPAATECTNPEICEVVEGCETTWGVCVVAQ